MVPEDAVVFQDSQSYVPIVRNKQIKLAQVKLGYDDGVNVQIMQGVANDDLVAVNVGQTARDGEPVRPVIAAETHLWPFTEMIKRQMLSRFRNITAPSARPLYQSLLNSILYNIACGTGG